MNTFQFISDLHLETFDNDDVNPLDFVKPSSDILIMAGDIGSLYKLKQLKNFLERVCQIYKIVVYVIGNHEWYKINNIIPQKCKILQDKLEYLNSNLKNLYILNRSSIKINDVCIVGATLWTDPKQSFNNFIVRIHNITIENYKKMHQQDLNYIINMKKYCEQKNLKMLVVTHHPPSSRILDNKKCKKNPNLYATDLEYLFDDGIINTWISGHTHKNYNIRIKNTLLISNQKGKTKDKIDDYSKTKILKI